MPAVPERPAQPLPTEQHEAVTKLQLSESRRHLAEFRKRQRLHRKARSYLGRLWASPVFFILAMWATSTHVEFPAILVVASILAILCALVQLHATGINRRVDALAELLKADQVAAGTERNSRDASATLDRRP